ncbi:MAG: DCC1-like thiol-disulfide oxidoreductase family protein [Polyangiales bacterium]
MGKSTEHSHQPRRIVLFDGVCNFCDHAINFIIDRDSRGRFEFASLQSDVGKRLKAEVGITGSDISTLVLIEGERAYTRSSAAVRIARQLDGAWPLLYALVLVPRPLRDWAYRYFAAHRYTWFGKLDACRVPSPEVRARFLDLTIQA